MRMMLVLDWKPAVAWDLEAGFARSYAIDRAALAAAGTLQLPPEFPVSLIHTLENRVMSTTNNVAAAVAAGLAKAKNNGVIAGQVLTAQSYCQYCRKPLTDAELAAHLEAGVTDELMCDACAESTDPTPTPVMTPQMQAMAAEIAKLKAENSKLANPKPASATPATKTPTPKTPELNLAKFMETLGNLSADAKRDAVLLKCIEHFRSTRPEDVAKYGNKIGTFAVKVHGFLHQWGITEEQVRAMVNSAKERKVVSTMSIPAKGARMMLYFDAKLRPSNDYQPIDASLKQGVVAGLGF